MEEEISLRELIEIILKGKWIIVGITLAALLLSGIVSFYVLDPTYEAKTVLALEQTILPEIQEEGIVGLIDTAFRTAEFKMQSIVTEAKTTAVLNRVMEKLKIDEEEMSLSVLSGKISIQNIKDTDLLEITVKDQDDQRATDIANTLAEELVESVQIMNEEKNTKNIALLENQVNGEQVKLEKRVAELKQFLQQPDSVMELEAELNTALKLLSDFQARKVNLQVVIQKVSTLIEAMERQLTEIPAKIELKDQDLKSEELNPVYTELKKELELNKALLTQLRTEEALIQEETAKISNTINNLQVKLADKRISLEQLQLKLDTVKENYVLFHNKWVESQFNEATMSGKAPLKIISQANMPQAPVAPRKMLNLAIAACLGVMLGVFVVLFREYWVKSATNIQA